jgi:type IX secretion system PorP/SprF family membrane protein
MIFCRRLSTILFIILICSNNESAGEQIPLNPISLRVFTPFILNPATAGSKDFLSATLTASLQGASKSQILSLSTRLVKRAPSYFLSPGNREFTKIGIGGFIFNDLSGSSRNLGVGVALSYHIPLDRQHFSFLSFGASVKGLNFRKDSVYSNDPGQSLTFKNVYYPDLDFGIYFYSPTLFAGVSLTNLRGNPEKPGNPGNYDIKASRLYYFQTGYKVLINRSLNFTIEPSVIISTDGSSQKFSDIIKPMVKLYLENYCFGTYFNDFDNMAVFFHYKYPRLNIGAFFKFNKRTQYFKRSMVAEVMLGINISKFAEHARW